VSATVAGLFIGFKPDVMYVYHPPLTVGIAAAVIGFLRRIPFVYDIQDLWPDSLAATGMIASENVLDVVAGVANRVYRRAAVVVAQSPGFVARLIERGVPPAKLRLIYNWCDEDALATRADDPGFDPRLLEGRFNVVFAGNMGKAQGLRAVVAAAGIVEKQDERVQFLFVGEGTDLNALKAYASELALRNVRFIPRLAMTQVGHLLNAADALLVHLQHCPLFAITVPSKTQAYLYAGKPIVMAVEGDAAALVAEASAGVCARPEDPDSIAGAIMTLVRLSPEERTAMGSRGRKFYDASLSLKAGTSQMIRAFREAAREPAIT
jgi:glycosyltransferase involved in cell wall biosynthesis